MAKNWCYMVRSIHTGVLSISTSYITVVGIHYHSSNCLYFAYIHTFSKIMSAVVQYIRDASFLSPPPRSSKKMKRMSSPPRLKPKDKKPLAKRQYTPKRRGLPIPPSIADELEQATRCLYAGCTNHASNPMLDRCERHSIGMLPPVHPSFVRNISEEEETFMTTAGYLKCETCKSCWVLEQSKVKLCINCIPIPE